MKDNKYIAQPFVPKTETKLVLENQQKPKLSLIARNKIIAKHGSNYLSSRATIINPSYGPAIDGVETKVKNYCDKCKVDKEVEFGDSYCPTCGVLFKSVRKGMAISLAKIDGLEEMVDDKMAELADRSKSKK